jgi:hypothetical protein
VTAAHLVHGQGVSRAYAGSAAGVAERVIAASVGLFGVCGLGLVRLALPERLRRHEALWVLPVGACTSGLALTALGFAAVPFSASLVAVIAAGALVAVFAFRRRPPRAASWGRRLREGRLAAWPLYVGLLILILAIVPMLRGPVPILHLHNGFPTVEGTGSDAHLAVGSAQFLQHYYPTSVHPEAPVDLMPTVWRSKFPIYYAFAGVASVSGLAPYQVISTLAAVMLALACIGFYLLARDVLGAGVAGGLAAMAIVGLDPIVLHTVVHPYFNQTWGFATVPFAIVLGWTSVRTAGRRTRGGLALTALFLLVCALAYPLAAPLPALAVALFWLGDRRRRRRRGEPLRSLRPRTLLGSVYRGRRSLLWMAPLGMALLVPIAAAMAKVSAAILLLAGVGSLRSWGGDLSGFFATHRFFAFANAGALYVYAPVIALGIYLALRRRPRELGWGLLAVMAFGLLTALYMRHRAYGYYFHFKVLAFVAPLILAVAVVGLGRMGRPWRLRVLGVALVLALLANAQSGAVGELGTTLNQLPKTVLAVQVLDRQLPRGSSIRLDMNPSLQLWTAYFLAEHPLCSQRPLLETSYPHVPLGRRAQYILAHDDLLRPFDAQGPPLRHIGEFRLYRAKPHLPGPDTCSQRMVQSAIREGSD